MPIIFDEPVRWWLGPLSGASGHHLDAWILGAWQQRRAERSADAWRPLRHDNAPTASIFTFRIAWNEFILALVLTDRPPRSLPVAASLFITDMGVDWGKVMAMGSLIAIAPLIFILVAARQIIGGLTAGAVKV